MGLAGTPCSLGKEGVPLFLPCTPRTQGACAVPLFSPLELLLRTWLCTTSCCCLGWAPGRARPKAHQPPEGRGAKLPPGTAQSCLGEADRGDLFPRAPSWRGWRGGSAQPACPWGGGCLPLRVSTLGSLWGGTPTPPAVPPWMGVPKGTWLRRVPGSGGCDCIPPAQLRAALLRFRGCRGAAAKRSGQGELISGVGAPGCPFVS